jgi:hypothetical protein
VLQLKKRVKSHLLLLDYSFRSRELSHFVGQHSFSIFMPAAVNYFAAGVALPEPTTSAMAAAAPLRHCERHLLDG